MPILDNRSYRKQLRAWIGDPTLTFNLLYSATRDGCSGQAFHQKCNNQGPTVSIGQNSAGYIIGGYTSIPWTSRGDYFNDDRAFLFQLFPNKVKFARNGNGNDVYDNATYGPTFGGDLNYNQTAFDTAGRYGYGRVRDRKGRFSWNGIPVQMPGVSESCGNDLLFFSDSNNGYDAYSDTADFGYMGTYYAANGFTANSYNTSGDYFYTNGYSYIGNSYNGNGYNAQTFTGNSNAYLDIEVYAVKQVNSEDELYEKDKPWRKTDINDWNNKTRGKLFDELVSFSTPTPAKVPAARLLLVGSVGAGKSSFFNTVRSVWKGKVRSQVATGTAPHSLTTKYRVYEIRGGHQTPAFRLCDTMGLEEDQGLDVGDMAYLLDGHVPDHFQFNPAVRITRKSLGFVKDPGLADAIHCVALVIDGSTYKVMSPKVKDKLLGLRTLALDRDIPVHVVLTKVDKVCKDVAEDPSVVFHSRVIEKKVKDISDAFGIQSNHVQPVKNYESETSIDPRVDILTLNALRQMTGSAEDYIEFKLDDMEETDTQMSKMNIKK
ncbi:interferon-induced protein 44-like [Lingula anatina]|uniref:Interferon-induced protein 44-like n=1 Tax=Lingula anatina TaxID=7574 RepID=A0A1S3JKD1_LINAN|nr:interferon-induced protein 44-like [Lingula anatina]|eukprot:XP_013410369.1 interferon-induced protein 44-like [Lingula anatina]